MSLLTEMYNESSYWDTVQKAKEAVLKGFDRMRVTKWVRGKKDPELDKVIKRFNVTMRDVVGDPRNWFTPKQPIPQI